MSWEACFLWNLMETWRHGGMMGWSDISWEARFLWWKLMESWRLWGVFFGCSIVLCFCAGILLGNDDPSKWNRWLELEGPRHLCGGDYALWLFAVPEWNTTFSFGSSSVGQAPSHFANDKMIPMIFLWYPHPLFSPILGQPLVPQPQAAGTIFAWSWCWNPTMPPAASAFAPKSNS